ncbi:Fis family transcriptional regulator [Sphingobium herbicidovorans NBRC 16415]|uniref:Fis family transcriptional regulator n=1 Tax=Sphingobium herbicidovorans (strain ATCC 700291 / DSM 11019 / CCUG 56400 / KCTC 2939 / LMG 18315 / NBRC 16415 / MH) TaxID=1219045 RepID=A0A086PFD2_SPHHM|nr:PEP-CTERM-box response regulator transcription factor [Sphingobium herbicidovorans]KFG92100.1 Fis family transcriptional regulator [Sphingobium herbicidovorans NBRC 16415]
MSDKRPKLLIVEDDPGLQRQLRWAYEDYQLFIAGDREEAIEMLRAESPDVVTLDLGLPPDPDGTSEGFATLAEMLRIKPDTKVIVASGHGARESALAAISGGAYDFYQKPVDIDELGLIVSRAFHVHALEKENARLAEAAPEQARVLGRLITGAAEMTKVARTIERVAATSLSVLLTGASGTGKALLAQGLHDASERRGGPFITINCSAIPEPLLEAELFGAHDGSDAKAGKIALAHRGTLFLDEVGEMPLALQAKLLRFMQNGVVDVTGDAQPLSVDARIVAATHHDVEKLIATGVFREDLYYLLAEVVVRIPALKDRPGDPALLARHFLNRFAKEMNPLVKGLAPDALAALDAWDWPGNVRELENRMKRGVIMADGKHVTAADLDLDGDRADGSDVVNLKAAREMADRRAIRRAIARTDGNISGAAKMLGISRPTLYDLLKQYQLQG